MDGGALSFWCHRGVCRFLVRKGGLFSLSNTVPLYYYIGVYAQCCFKLLIFGGLIKREIQNKNPDARTSGVD